MNFKHHFSPTTVKKHLKDDREKNTRHRTSRRGEVGRCSWELKGFWQSFRISLSPVTGAISFTFLTAQVAAGTFYTPIMFIQGDAPCMYVPLGPLALILVPVGLLLQHDH